MGWASSMKEKSSLPIRGLMPNSARSSPNVLHATCQAKRAISSSFTNTGVPLTCVTSAVAPKLAAWACARAGIRVRRSCRVSRLRERTLIFISALSGMTLAASPATMLPTVITAASSGSTLRDTMLCNAVVICAATSTGSMALCGIAPCPPQPRTVIWN